MMRRYFGRSDRVLLAGAFSRNVRRRACALAALCGLWLLAAGLHAQAEDAAAVVELELSEEDWATPSVALGVERVTTVAFFDDGGRPLPIADLAGPPDRQGWLLYGAASPPHGHVATFQATQRGTGNVVAFLEGVDRPVHIEVAAGDSQPASQVVVRIAQPAVPEQPTRPARSDGASLSGGELADAIRDYLLDNPDVLREALDPARQLAATAQRMRGELLGAEGCRRAATRRRR